MSRLSLIPAATATATAIALAALSAPAAGQDVPRGCFARMYSAAHLAAHPDQVVDWITVNFLPDSYNPGQTVAQIRARMADQGHAGRQGIGGMVLSEVASNWMQPLTFGVFCDGGAFEVIRHDGAELVIRTQYLRVATDGCNGEAIAASLAERHDDLTIYRLDAAPDAVCEAR